MGEIEKGTCEVCGKTNVQLQRKYYHYDINCECCGCKLEGENVHFEICKYCNDCEPRPPYKISAVVNPF